MATTDVRPLIAEAVKAGVRFRLSGDDVETCGLDGLSDGLKDALAANLDGLWEHLDNGQDRLPITLAEQLGLRITLIERRAEAKQAVRTLMRQRRAGPGYLAIDIETAAKDGLGCSRPWVAIRKTKDKKTGRMLGDLCLNQPKAADDKDPIATHPHDACIKLMQLSADGQTIFLFRSEALNLIAGSHWLRRQHLIIHNAGFECAFLRLYPYKPPLGRKALGKVDCTMQAVGLAHGVETTWTDIDGTKRGGRSLAAAARSFLGIDMPKEHGSSDWSAETLSDGQLAYAALDAALAHRLWAVLPDELWQMGCWQAYKLQRDAIPAVVQMELRGILLDRAEHAQQVEQWSVELAKAREQFHIETGKIPPSTHVRGRDGHC